MSTPRRPNSIGKGNSLLYALFVAAFLVWQSIEAGYDNQQGFYVRNKEVPILTIISCSTFMAVGLGVNILDTLQTLSALVDRNSRLISSIARKNNIQSEELSEGLEPENHDNHDKN